MENIKRYTYFLTVGKRDYYLNLEKSCFSSKRKAINEVNKLFNINDSYKFQDDRSFESGKRIQKYLVRIEKQLLN